MDLDPRRLGVLAVVARTGGVLAAARALRVTPSAVSQQLARLEREAGVALLIRGGGRRIELTAAGAALAEHGSRIDDQVAAAAAELTALTRRVTGSVTLVAFMTTITTLVAPAVARLREEQPGVRLRVLDQPEEAALAGLRAGTVDLVVLERDAADLRPAGRGLRDVPLLDDPYLVVLPAGWALPAAARSSDRLGAVAALPWVTGPQGSATRNVLDRLGRTTGVRPRIEHEALEFPSVLALVAAGLGVALVPRLALPAGDSPDRRITWWQSPGLGSRRLLARHRSSRGEPAPATRSVLDLLATQAGRL